MSVTILVRLRANRFARRAVISGLVAIVAGIAGFSGQASAQVVNGNFATTLDSSTYNLTAPGTSNSDLPDWTTSMAGTSGSFEPGCVVIGNTFSGCQYISATGAEVPTTPAGTNYLAVEVDDISGTLYKDSISQMISLTAGNIYTLTFNVAATETECGNGSVGASCGNPPGNNISWTVSVAGNALPGNTTTTINLPSNDATAWTAESYTFTAAGTAGSTYSEALEFLASSSTAGPPIALLDGITMVDNTTTTNHGSVPEPASLTLLGVGLAGLVKLRRRRASLAV